MKPIVEVPQNVMDVVDTCARIIGNSAASFHKHSILVDIRHGETRSPIEQIFFSAFVTLGDLTGLDDQWPVRTKLGEEWAGLFLNRQFKIEKYVVDFLICYRTEQMTLDGESREVVIECDGHEFHEMTEPQRRYEKAKDRFLQKKNFKVFRYTGSDIVKNHFQITAEVMSYLTEVPQEDLLETINKYMG